jgi:hypothetical protein
MQLEIFNTIRNELTKAAIEAVWIQWRSIGTLIESERVSRSLVDPEALLLMSLNLGHHEKRLWDIMDSWARNGSQLFSIQRLKNLKKTFPDKTQDRLSEFAWKAKVKGKDQRWRNLMGESSTIQTRSQELWKAYPASWRSSAIMLRLRLGFGIGAVSDLLTILISHRGDWVSPRSLAKAINYSVYSIRRSADDLADARLIESTRKKPVQYRIEPKAWSGLLGIDEPIPDWRFWYQIYSFVSSLIVSTESGDWDELSSYLLSSKLRDSIELHEDAFSLNHIEYPISRDFTGDEYLPAFKNFIGNLGEWIVQHA